ncbi:hypothetical protein I4U23_023660 [Adineta vaga]|nr:hypothetical protein I4U23_023660 [Adineta vaga]
MSFVDQHKPQILSCLNCQSINDENNNFSNSICTKCEDRNDKESQRMMIVPDISSDDESGCSSCSSSVNDSEFISLDTRKLWHEIVHLIKCIYRETNLEFTENHSTDELCKAKEYVQILTQFDSESLFNKIESIILEYVIEIRHQVLKRSQTCLQTSNDVQLLISYLLDEYQTFIQAVKNVSTILTYFEENYLKSFHLTWLLYNQHLYEKLVYMDKNIQQSMSTMIDLLHPTNDHQEDYSPAEYTQLINRFLEFDEQMSEIACVYKDCQMKMNSMTRNALNSNQNTIGLVVATSKKKSRKKTKKIHEENDGNMNSTITSALNIPLANILSETIDPSQHGSNGSSIGSGVGGKESSSISSFDDYLLDNNTSSSSFTKEETDQLIENNNTDLHNQLFHGLLNNHSPMTQIQQEIDELKLHETTIPITANINEEKSKTIENQIPLIDDKQISSVSSTKKSKSHRRKESSNSTTKVSSSTLPKTSLTPDIILPPKPPSSTTSKLQADLRSLTIPSLSKTEIPTCPSLLSAKMQSVSFTAGTFASITTDESSSLSSTNQTRLNLNLSHKSGSLTTKHEQLLRQCASPNDISTLLSSLKSSKFNQDPRKSSFDEKNCEFCCCDLFPDSNSSMAGSCIACMSVSSNSTSISGFNQRDCETKGRLQLKMKQRTVQNTSEQTKLSIGNKSKSKPCDNNIDDLVRFIDGDEKITDGSTTKKNKKKKDKQSKSNSINEDIQQKKLDKTIVNDPIVETSQPLSKRQQKAKLKLEKQQTIIKESATNPSPLPSPPSSPPSSPPPSLLPEKIDSHSITTESLPEAFQHPSEEEINWITISRKQSKHKPTPPASNPSKSKKQQINNKTKITNTQVLAQQKVIPEIVPNSNKQQPTTAMISKRAQNQVKTHAQEKSELPSAWAVPEQMPAPPTSTLLATAPVFIPSSSLIKPNSIDDIVPLEEPTSSPSTSSLYWNPNDYHPPGPVQRPISSFLPSPGPLQSTISRCIQRPSSEPRTTTLFPTYSPMNYTISTATSAWNDLPNTNSNQTQWKYPNDEQYQTSTTIPNDFPLYDPFNSGAALNIPSSSLLTNRMEEYFNGLPIAKDNDVNDMDALDKEIEDFKKYYMDETS